MKRTLLTFSLLLSPLASAQEVLAAAPPPAAEPTLELALKAGLHLSQVYGPLETTFDGVLKVGVAPWRFKRLQAFVDLGFSQPRHQTVASDPRLESGADYTSTLVVYDVRTTLGAQYFFRSPAEKWVPWAGAGLRAHFLTFEAAGGSAEAFGLHTETVTRVGGTLLAGVGYRLGPGLVLGELSLTFVPVAERVTGPSNVGAFSAQVGYGLLW